MKRPLPRSRLEKPRSREPSQPALSYEHIENFTKDIEVRRDLGNRASPVNRAHMKRPSTLIFMELTHVGFEWGSWLQCPAVFKLEVGLSRLRS